jgi:nucleoside-triphosphatase THEP1
VNLLLSGQIGVGKTSVCQKVVELAQAQGHHPRGVLTPPLVDASGAKIGFEALDVGSGRRWLLAHTKRDRGGPRIGPYTFDRRGLDRAIDLLRDAIEGGADLLIVDEIGPLELEQGNGFAPVLDQLPLHGPGHILLVVRPALLQELRRRLSSADVTIFTVTRGNRDNLPHRMMRELWADDVPRTDAVPLGGGQDRRPVEEQHSARD